MVRPGLQPVRHRWFQSVMHARRALVVAAMLAPSTVVAAPKDQPLPGFAGLTYRDVEVHSGCTDTIRVITRTKKVDDHDLVTLLTWPRITGLDFSPDDPKKAKTSMRRFQEWFQKLQKQATRVKDRQAGLAFDEALSAQVRVEALARFVIAEEHLIDLIAGIEVPRHVRKDPEIVDAYCDLLSEHTEALERQVEDVREVCQKLIADEGVGDGWWTAVCATP